VGGRPVIETLFERDYNNSYLMGTNVQSGLSGKKVVSILSSGSTIA
jgi:hypothetical protein